MTVRSIAFCTTEFRAGGAERCLAQLALRLDRRRFRARVFVLAAPPPEGQRQLVESLESADVPVEFLGARRFWQAPRVVAQLAGRLREERAELLQTFLFHANTLGCLAARRAGVPRVVAGIRVAERGLAWHRWVQRGLASRCDRFVCVSDDVARFAAASGLPAERLTVIPNGVDLTRIDAQARVALRDLGVDARRRAICAIGRLDRQKRVDLLLAACAANPRLLAEHDLLVVGEGPLRPALEEQALNLGLADRVHWLGWRADAIGVLKSCDLLVHTAEWEGLANVVLEAMACGRAVAARPAEGMEQLLGAAATEQIVPGSAPAFAERVVELLRDPARAARLGAENRLRAAQNFSLEAMVERYEQLYSELLV